MFLCNVIRRGTINRKLPVTNGMFPSWTCILKSSEFAVEDLNLKASITNSIKNNFSDKYKVYYFRSQKNLLC